MNKAWNTKEVGYHTGSNDYWVSVRGVVYDLTKFYKIQSVPCLPSLSSQADLFPCALQALRHHRARGYFVGHARARWLGPDQLLPDVSSTTARHLSPLLTRRLAQPSHYRLPRSRHFDELDDAIRREPLRSPSIPPRRANLSTPRTSPLSFPVSYQLFLLSVISRANLPLLSRCSHLG